MVTVNYICNLKQCNTILLHNYTRVMLLCVYGQVHGIALSLSLFPIAFALCVCVVFSCCNCYFKSLSLTCFSFLYPPPLSSSLPLSLFLPLPLSSSLLPPPSLSLYRILLSVEKNTVKIKEHGKVVLLLEKSAGGK